MTISEYVERDSGFGLDSFAVVQKGRRRELFRTLWIVVGLLLAQLPLRMAASGELTTPEPFLRSVAAHLSLIVDVMMIVAYLLAAYRAFGLLRSAYPRRLWALINKVGVGFILVGAGLDLWEDVRLWGIVDVSTLSVDSGLGLSIHDSLGVGPTHPAAYTMIMRAVIAVGALLMLLSFVGYRGGRHRFDEFIPRASDIQSGGTVICCSGGGIRSAAFCLGGLEALSDRGIYQGSDAVVGVSGGGYMAAAYHVVRWGPADTSPDALADSGEWQPSVSGSPPFALDSPETGWVRRHTQYVLNGVRVAVQGGLSLGFGLAVNLILLTVILGSTAWLLAWLYLASGRLVFWAPDTGSADLPYSIAGDIAEGWKWTTWVWLAPVLGLTLFVIEKAGDRYFTTMPRAVQGPMRVASSWLILGGTALGVLVTVVPWVLSEVGQYAATSSSTYAGVLYQLGLVPADACQAAIDARHSACGVEADPATGETAVTAPPAAIPGVSLATIIGAILAVLASARSAGTSEKEGSGLGGLLRKMWAKLKDPITPWLALTLVLLVIGLLFLRWIAKLVQDPELLSEWRYVYVFAALLLAIKLLTDANRTSLHYFFRERISYAFFVRRRNRQVEPVPYSRPLRFSDAAPKDAGPALVSCAVANVNDEELVPARRGCIPFVFDHAQIGLTDRLLPDHAARRASSAYELAADFRYRDATIPAAVAMSAAAFSPLAGRENVRLGPYRAVLALGNARLGVWLPNPVWVDEVGLVKRLLRLNRPLEAARIAAGLPRHGNPENVVEYRISAHELRRLAVLDNARVQLDSRLADLASTAEGHSANAQQACTLAAEAFRAELEQWRPRSWVWYAIEVARDIFKKPGFTRLAKEAFGKTSVFDRFLYVTDGGHYDNLGLIEALRRKPDAIYVLDASNDVEDTFSALGQAIATARMDLGCEVNMDPRGMRRLAETRSGAAWCVGRYSFTSGETGDIYLAKAVLLDGLTWDVETYALENADFPRTSTAKQTYSEFDFEAYRALGNLAVSKLLASPDYGSAQGASASG